MSNVIHRTTYQYFTQVNTPDYSTEDWIINPDLTAVSGVDQKYWIVSGEDVFEMSDTEKDTIYLDEFKTTKNKSIDKRTVELIETGFTYNNKVFSLSSNAQSYWNGLGNLAANGLFTEPDDFPLVVNTLDDADTYEITNIADAIGLFATAAATVKACLGSGTAIKNQIRAATTISGVDAISDNR